MHEFSKDVNNLSEVYNPNYTDVPYYNQSVLVPAMPAAGAANQAYMADPVSNTNDDPTYV